MARARHGQVDRLLSPGRIRHRPSCRIDHGDRPARAPRPAPLRGPVSVAGPQGRITSIAPMPGPLRNAVLGAVAATLIAGCGSDDGTIPQDNADDLITR